MKRNNNMFMYVFSIILVVISNVLYHICQKTTPEKANPFIALFATYVTAAIITVIVFIFSKTEKTFFESIKELNWSSIVLGISIIGLELGYILAYRAGWNISIGSLVANIFLAVLLIPIGIIFFKEGFDVKKLYGVVLCIIGLILINR